MHVAALIGPPVERNASVADYPMALREAGECARRRVAEDGPPDAAMIADAARFAGALGPRQERHFWRGECPACRLPESLRLTPRRARVEVRCDSRVCDPFALEAQIDGRLSARGIFGFRDLDFPWKARAVDSETRLSFGKAAR